MRIHVSVLALFVSVFTALVLLPQTAAAQSFGAKGGIDVGGGSFEIPGVTVHPSSRTGLGGGLFMQLSSSRPVGLQIEALVGQTGFVISSRSCASSCFSIFGVSEGTVWMTYLQIPVLARFTIRDSGWARPYLIVGPSLAAKLSARAYLPPTVPSVSEADRIKRFDIGVTVGGGVDIGRKVIDVRYTAGLINTTTMAIGGQTAKNRTISAMFGIRFGK